MTSGIRHLFAVQATFGHVLPAIRLARLMLARGHDAVFALSDRYGALMDLYGIEHVPVSNTGLPFLATHDWYDPGTVALQVRVLSGLVDRIRPDVLVAGPLGLATFIVAEQRSLPTVVIGYGEHLYPGVNDRDPTRWWRLKTLTNFYNAARQVHGLPPVPPDPLESPLLGSAYLLRGVPQFTSPVEPPPLVRHVGGLYWEPEVQDVRLAQFIEAGRARGQRLVYAQIGRLFEKPWIWTRLMDALSDADVACVADTGRADYLRDGAPSYPACYATRFASVGGVPGADAVICSGQTAAVLGAITHQRPLLCVPSSADADEMASRVVACGIGIKVNVESELNRDTIERFLTRVHGGEFAPGLARLRAHLQEWALAEPSLGDVALDLVAPPQWPARQSAFDSTRATVRA